ncbi:MAG: NosD domain-containing protein [Psychrobacillus psychrodurans]|uniref:right-handed parallel beta-helix repeat-containing protein n=1 Tax=Psychrobacillus sp. MER TA 171 TaxID=2939577 RepID=UPI00203CE999|nr:NosD domain-containing protein [Psychrobacillus sp. MER TA 171]MCM3357151.1 hypothetical protein [Psychrobacillus sp. MER TA 171]
MRKFVFTICCFIFVLTFIPTHSNAGPKHPLGLSTASQVEKSEKNVKSRLQKLIDNTESGGTLLLEGRVYRGSLVISKPITIEGVEGTEIHSISTVLTISDTENVEVNNIVFQAEDISIFADNVKNLSLKNIQIEESKQGIKITNSENIRLEHVNIIGNNGHFSTKGHAIAIYKSKKIEAIDSYIDGMMDGFYLESVSDIVLSENLIQNSRYAMHIMYGEDVELLNNEVFNNMTGFMVMIAENVQIFNNIVARNNTLNSLGVYVYDVRNVIFENNKLNENTTAMDVQNAREMNITRNLFSTNGTVLQVRQSGDVLVHRNEFHGNILAARTDQQGIQLKSNYYDDYNGKDYDGDGIGDTPYIATNSFGQWMVRKPVYQYFMESPSVVTLNMMDTEVTGNNMLVVVDEQPTMLKNQINLDLKIHIWQLLTSSSLIIGAFIVRRKLK